MNSTAFLIGKAAALALAAIGMMPPGVAIQPTVWTMAGHAPPQLNVFYEHDAGRVAHQWQMAHWSQYETSIMTSDGGIMLDGAYQRALIVTARITARGNAEMRYVIPYQPDGVHVAIYPMMLIEHGGCTYLPSHVTEPILRGLQQDVDSYGAVALSFAPPLSAQENACNQARAV